MYILVNKDTKVLYKVSINEPILNDEIPINEIAKIYACYRKVFG